MAPDADKLRQVAATYDVNGSLAVEECGTLGTTKPQDPFVPASTDSLECVLQPRVLTDFSYIEQPVRCFLTYQDKHLACNGKSACFMATHDHQSRASATSKWKNEFAILPQPDGVSVLLQNTKTRQYLCSGSNGGVYASKTACEDTEKWIMTKSSRSGDSREGFCIRSLMSQRTLVCAGNVVHTVEDRDEKSNTFMLWTVDFTSGELCYLSLASTDKRRVRCDLFGNLSLSQKYQGWEAWRLSEAGDGYVRISPWAHSELLLSSNDEGHVCTTEERGPCETWSLEKAPNGLDGVVIKSAQNGRVLRYDQQEGLFHTIPGTSHLFDESCAWDLESLHRQTYYLVANDTGRKLEAARKGLGTSGLPVRFSSDEWKIISSHDEPGVVMLFSNARQQYLLSDTDGEVSLTDELPRDGSAKWAIEEREIGFVILSQTTKRVLVAPENGPICTVEAGTMVVGSTRWKLEPKIPRQVNKEKMQAVGAAVAIGVAGTVATPFLIGGAIGVLGVAHVGVAGEIAIGSIRAVEALNTITRVTLSSSQLMISQSSFLSADSERDYENGGIGNRPFCNWRSW